MNCSNANSNDAHSIKPEENKHSQIFSSVSTFEQGQKQGSDGSSAHFGETFSPNSVALWNNSSLKVSRDPFWHESLCTLVGTAISEQAQGSVL